MANFTKLTNPLPAPSGQLPDGSTIFNTYAAQNTLLEACAKNKQNLNITVQDRGHIAGAANYAYHVIISAGSFFEVGGYIYTSTVEQKLGMTGKKEERKYVVCFLSMDETTGEVDIHAALINEILPNRSSWTFESARFYTNKFKWYENNTAGIRITKDDKGFLIDVPTYSRRRMIPKIIRFLPMKQGDDRLLGSDFTSSKPFITIEDFIDVPVGTRIQKVKDESFETTAQRETLYYYHFPLAMYGEEWRCSVYHAHEKYTFLKVK